ncbi:MAG TPA: 50S ribosomal protein L35 [Clostridiales bacterium]|jgi:large subunit ribosomal protein L35|nr:50S ribosomal protein L35 [Clostridiales bacterium]
MPKMKSHTGAKKRFRVTGGGKLKRGQQGKNHILTKKRRKTIRNLRQTAYVSETQSSTIKKMIQG